MDSIQGQKRKNEKDYQINLNKKRARCPTPVSPTPVRSEKTPNKDKGEEKPPGKKIKTEAQSPKAEGPPNEKPNHSQKAKYRALRVPVDEEFAARRNGGEETVEPLDKKPKDAVSVDEEFAARSNKMEETEEPRDEKPNDA